MPGGVFTIGPMYIFLYVFSLVIDFEFDVRNENERVFYSFFCNFSIDINSSKNLRKSFVPARSFTFLSAEELDEIRNQVNEYLDSTDDPDNVPSDFIDEFYSPFDFEEDDPEDEFINYEEEDEPFWDDFYIDWSKPPASLD